MIGVSRMNDVLGGWAEGARRIAAAPRMPVGASALLGLLAVIEAIANAVTTPLPGYTGGAALYSLVLSLLALATTLPLALLWIRPAAAALAVSAAGALSLAAFQTLTVAGAAAQLIAVYRLSRHGSPPLAAVLAAPYLLLALAGPQGFEAHVLTVLLASLVPIAGLAGIALRARREALENSTARQTTIDSLLEHTARGERARIARELHDIVAHHISMVVVQAETARLATPGMPAAGAQRLRDIGDTARAALTEMRRLLGVLRVDTEADTADRQPQPGLSQLIDLVDSSREASGVATRLILRSPPATLQPAVELAAYRIVQEALTNARRHAPGAAVDVELEYAEGGLRLRIRDNGPGPPPNHPTGGHGLLGMRERAAAVGGEVRTGAAAGGGFLVTARLPAKEETGG